jgi:hypothetical protein
MLGTRVLALAPMVIIPAIAARDNRTFVQIGLGSKLDE